MKKFKIHILFLMLITLITSCTRDKDPVSPGSSDGDLCVLNMKDIDLSSLDSDQDLLIPFRLSPDAIGAEIEFPSDIDEFNEWACIVDFENNESDVMFLFVEANETGEPRSATIKVYGSKQLAKSGTRSARNAEADDATEEQSIPIAQKSVLSENIPKRFGVGFGLDLNATMDDKGLRGQILDFNKLRDAGQAPQRITSTSSSKGTSHIGTSQKDVISKYAAAAKAGFSCFGFRGEASASFDQNNETSRFHEYGLYTYEVAKGTYSLSQEIIPALREEFLSKYFERLINVENFDTKAINDVIRAFGTHLVFKVDIGARINYSIILDRSTAKNSQNIKASLEAGFSMGVGYGEASASTEQGKAFEENKSSMKVQTKCVGGGDNATELIKNKKFKEWEAGLASDRNWAIVAFSGDDALIPLWELVENPERREALKSAIMGHINNGWKANTNIDVQKLTIKNLDWKTKNENVYGPTSIKLLRDVNGLPFAEVCLEYIPDILPKSKMTVVYPIGIDRKPVRSRGFFIGNEAKVPGFVNWDAKTGVATFERIDEDTPVGQIEELYIQGYVLTNKSIDKASEAVIEDVYVDYSWLTGGEEGCRIPGVVKIGMNAIVSQGCAKAMGTRPNTHYNFKPVDTGGSVGSSSNNIVSQAIYRDRDLNWRYNYISVVYLIADKESDRTYSVLTEADFEAIVAHLGGGTTALKRMAKGELSGYDIGGKGRSTKVIYTPQWEYNVNTDYVHEWAQNKSGKIETIIRYDDHKILPPLTEDHDHIGATPFSLVQFHYSRTPQFIYQTK